LSSQIGSVGGNDYRCGIACGMNFLLTNFLAVFVANRFEGSRLVRNVPCQMKVSGVARGLLGSGVGGPTSGIALAWKFQRLDSKTFPVQKKFNRVATCVANHWNNLSFLPFPIPMREQV